MTDPVDMDPRQPPDQHDLGAVQLTIAEDGAIAWCSQFGWAGV